MTKYNELRATVSPMETTFETGAGAVQMMRDTDVKRSVIARTFGATERTLANWLERFDRDGVDCLRHKEGRAGRRPSP